MTEVRKQKSDDRGQATLELTVALIIVMLLLVGAVKTFVWLNERMVMRQQDFESSRVAAGSTAPAGVTYSALDNATPNDLKISGEVVVDESAYPALNIFEKLN